MAKDHRDGSRKKRKQGQVAGKVVGKDAGEIKCKLTKAETCKSVPELVEAP